MFQLIYPRTSPRHRGSIRRPAAAFKDAGRSVSGERRLWTRTKCSATRCVDDDVAQTLRRVRSRRQRLPKSIRRKALAFYKQRFADASDFTFSFVGNVDTLTLKPLVEKYLATLPSIQRKETFRDTAAVRRRASSRKWYARASSPRPTR